MITYRIFIGNIYLMQVYLQIDHILFDFYGTTIKSIREN